MRNTLNIIAGSAAVLLSFSSAWILLDYRLFQREPLHIPAGTAYHVIVPGTSLKQLAHDLHQQGIIDEPGWFVWMARLGGQAGQIQAGEYRIASSMTPRQLLQGFVRGDVITYSLTLLEGWTFRQALDAIRANPVLTHTLDGLDEQEIMAVLGYPGVHPEGRFYPETYHFSRGMSDREFLARAYQAMQECLERQWRDRAPDLPFDRPDEALVLASIIEKETADPGERTRIAGVFVRRLQQGMHLQTDPTVIYGLDSNWDGNLRRRDLRADTPYNTYTRKGLPPTPIALPGCDSVHAALHPDDGDALYFVARGDGSHQFSATLEEHNAAVIRYQLGGRRKPFSSMPVIDEDRKQTP